MRLEKLQSELLPPPALRPEWDEATSGLLSLTTSPFPRRRPVAQLPRVPGAAAALPPRPLRLLLLPLPLRGSLWRPPSSLGLRASTFEYACVAPTRAVTRPCQLISTLPSSAPPSPVHFPALPVLFSPFPQNSVFRRPAPRRPQQLHMRRTARPTVGFGVHAGVKGTHRFGACQGHAPGRARAKSQAPPACSARATPLGL